MKATRIRELMENTDLGVVDDGKSISVIERVKNKRHHPYYEAKLLTVSKKDAIKLALLLIKAAQQ